MEKILRKVKCEDRLPDGLGYYHTNNGMLLFYPNEKRFFIHTENLPVANVGYWYEEAEVSELEDFKIMQKKIKLYEELGEAFKNLEIHQRKKIQRLESLNDYNKGYARVLIKIVGLQKETLDINNELLKEAFEAGRELHHDIFNSEHTYKYETFEDYLKSLEDI